MLPGVHQGVQRALLHALRFRRHRGADDSGRRPDHVADVAPAGRVNRRFSSTSSRRAAALRPDRTSRAPEWRPRAGFLPRGRRGPGPAAPN